MSGIHLPPAPTSVPHIADVDPTPTQVLLGIDAAWTAGQPNAGFSTVEPWLPVDPRHIPKAVDAQEADAGSVLHVARRLIALRKRHPALRVGASS